MGRATKMVSKPTPMPKPVDRDRRGKPVGNFPDGVRPMATGEKAYDDAPKRPKGMK